MKDKIVNLFENHIEKIIFAIIGIVCIWLFMTRVLFSPNVVSYENKHFGPSGIDAYVREQAKDLEAMLKIEQPPQPSSATSSKVEQFVAMLNSPLKGDIDTSVHLPLPHHTAEGAVARGTYQLPEIGEVKDVDVEHIRAVAYVPIQEVTAENPYEEGRSQPNDIDLVTVEAKFNVTELYDRFYRCFAGQNVPVEARDPCLAEPVFAAVHLQRQELRDDGGWSDWQNVPRPKTDPYKKMFQIIEDPENLPPGGVKVRLLQFDNPMVQLELLQPMAYQIASPDEEWFPPSLHRKFVRLKQKEELEERLDAREEERKEREEEERRSRGRGTRYDSRRSSGVYDSSRGREDYGPGGTRTSGRGARRPGTDRSRAYEGTGRSARGQPRGRGRDEAATEMDYYLTDREATRRPSSDEVYYELRELLITPRTDLSKREEPVTFWAHDDSVEPGGTYRYRIRLGVFNPLAGTRRPSKDVNTKRDQVILWSDFSERTEPVDILERLYFFANDIQEAAKRVTVQVCKYVLGYWYSHDFLVKPGEAIGRTMENEAAESQERERPRGRMLGLSALDYMPPSPSPQEKAAIPEEINYSTGAVLVDAVRVNDWAGRRNLQRRQYYDMLYSYDGANIDRMPIASRNWPQELRTAFYEIKNSQRKPPEPLRAWDSSAGGGRRRRMGAGYEGMEDYEEYMMMEEMMMGPGRR
jgi:hypothetical protein